MCQGSPVSPREVPGGPPKCPGSSRGRKTQLLSADLWVGRVLILSVWGALLPYRALTRRSALPMSFSLSLSRKRRLPGPQNAQNAGAEGGGFPSGCPRAFSLCLSMKMPSRKRLFSASKNRACDGFFSLPVEEKQLFRATPPSIAPPLPPEGPGGLAGCACDGLSPLPVEEKAIMGLGVRLRCPFPPACRGKCNFSALTGGPG